MKMNISDTLLLKQTMLSVVLLILLSWADLVNSYVLDNGIIIGNDESNKPITCWTCPNKTNNEECNDWAPDLECPTNHTVCKTVHRLSAGSRRSVSVYKQCAKERDCTEAHIGCHSSPGTPGVVDCVSCCNQAYCNEEAPVNQSHALLLSALDTSSSHRLSPKWDIILLCAIPALLTHSITGRLRTLFHSDVCAS